MLMLHLLLLLAAGGALAWWSESLNTNAPRWVSLAVLALLLQFAVIYLFGETRYDFTKSRQCRRSSSV